MLVRVLGIVPFPFHLCTYCIHADDGIQAQLFATISNFRLQFCLRFPFPGRPSRSCGNREGVVRDFLTLTFAASRSFVIAPSFP